MLTPLSSAGLALGVVVGRSGAATSSREGFESICVLGAWRRQVGRFQRRQRERSLELAHEGVGRQRCNDGGSGVSVIRFLKGHLSFYVF